MRLVIFMVGLVIFAGLGMWDRFSILDFVLILMLAGVVFGYGPGVIGIFSDSFDGDSGSDIGGGDGFGGGGDFF